MIAALNYCAVVHNGDTAHVSCAFTPGGIAVIFFSIVGTLAAAGLLAAYLYHHHMSHQHRDPGPPHK